MRRFSAAFRLLSCFLLTLGGLAATTTCPAQAQTRALPLEIVPYDAAYRGGVKVAVGDVNGDGVADIVTAPGAGASADVRVFDGANGAQILQFFAYDPAFTGGISLAVGDATGDGLADIVTAPSVGGQPFVRVFNGTTGVAVSSFFAFDPAFRGGVNVAVGQRATPTAGTIPTIIAAPQQGGEPFVAEFNGQTGAFVTGFYAFDRAFRGGVNVATADFNFDETTEIVCGAGAGGVPVVAVFNVSNFIATPTQPQPPLFRLFQPYASDFRGGVAVSTATLDGIEFLEVITGSGSGIPAQVRAFTLDEFAVSSEVQAIRNFQPFDAGFTGGVSVGGTQRGGFFSPNSTLVAVGAGPGGSPVVRLYDGRMSVASSFLAFDAAFRGGVRTATGDLNGDGSPDLLFTPGAGGVPIVGIIDGRTGLPGGVFFAFDAAFRGGARIASGDLDNDGDDDVIAAAGAGGVPVVQTFDGKSLAPTASFLAYGDAFRGGVEVAAGDVNGDFTADIITGPGAGALAQVRAFDAGTRTEILGFTAYDTSYLGGITVAAGDFNGDGLAEIVTGTLPGGVPEVRIFSGLGGELTRFLAFDAGFRGGISVAVSDFDFGFETYVAVGAGAGGVAQVRAFAPFSSTTGSALFLGSVDAFPGFGGGVYVSSFQGGATASGYGVFASAGAGGAPAISRVFPIPPGSGGGSSF